MGCERNLDVGARMFETGYWLRHGREVGDGIENGYEGCLVLSHGLAFVCDSYKWAIEDPDPAFPAELEDQIEMTPKKKIR